MPISFNDIEEVHKLLTAGVKVDEEGEYCEPVKAGKSVKNPNFPLRFIKPYYISIRK